MKTKKFREMEFRNLMVEFAKLIEPGVYVEIGVKRGWTFNAVAPFCDRAIGIDIKPMPDVLQRSNVELHQMPSDLFAKLWEKTPLNEIDLLFIDGDHAKEAVLRDLHTFLPFVRTGTGLIMLHDTHPVNPRLMTPSYCFDAWEVAAGVHSSPEWSDVEIVTIPGPWAGLSILRKVGRHHLAWQ